MDNFQEKTSDYQDNTDTLNLEESYTEAMRLLESDDLNDLYEAKGILEKIRGFKNTDEILDGFEDIYTKKQEELQEKAEQQRLEEEQRIFEKEIAAGRKRNIIAICAVSFVAVATIVVASIFYFIPLIRYKMALSDMAEGKYEQAYSALNDLGDFNDSAEKIRESKYNRAKQLFKDGDYGGAYALLCEIGDYSDAQSCLNDCLYEEGKELIGQKRWSKAKFNFQRLGDYKDSKEYIKECTYMEANDLAQKGKWEEAMENYFLLQIDEVYKDSDILLIKAKYNCAGIFADAGRFTEAVELYNQVGEEYENTHLLKQQAMLNYVKNHQNSDDLTTYDYLLELKEENFETSNDIYKSIFGWRAECIINDSKTGTQDMDKISRTKNVYFHVTLQGGPPEGKTTVRYVITFPSGSTEKDTFTKDWVKGDSGVTWVWYTHPENGAVGNAYIKLYDAENNLIGEDLIYITY